MAKSCCLKPSGILFKSASALPNGEPSLRNTKCYMNFLGGCSTKLSREHLISDGIPRLTERNRLITSEGELDNPFALSRTTKVLCTTHNSMMGALIDPVGIALHAAINASMRGEKARTTLFSGPDVEKYILQRLCAHHFGGIFTNGGKSLRDLPLDMNAVEKAFMTGSFDNNCGLFVGPPPSHVNPETTSWDIAPLLVQNGATGGMEIGGCRLSFGAVGLSLLLKTTDIDTIGQVIYRPRGIEIAPVGKRKSVLRFSWPSTGSKQWVSFSQIAAP